MRSRPVRMVIPAVVLATAALTLTACSSHDSSAGSTGNAGNAAAVPSDPTTGSMPASSGDDGSTGAPATGESSATSSGTTVQSRSGNASSTSHACASSQLKVAQADQSVGAGQRYAKIVFTNTASTSCTLTGYPGVSYVAAAGAQSGNPATRTGATVHTITLAAHGSASATMHDSDGMGGYTPGQCKLTSVQGLRIYPPNQKAALFIPWKTQHCAGTTIHPLTIGPVHS